MTANAEKIGLLGGTVPQSNHLHLFSGNIAKNVVRFLDLDTNDVSRGLDINKKSVRYDEKIPKELLQRLQEIAVICELVAIYFNGDIEKTALWFKIKNPALGGLAPRDMIRFGRFKKLEKFVRNALAGITP